MARNCSDEKRVYSNSTGYTSKEEHEVDDDEEEEALSLSDLPNTEETQLSRKQEAQSMEPQEEFDFSSWTGSNILTGPEMCAADEVFYQGQILPFRRSVSSETGLVGHRKLSRCISESNSIDQSYSGESTTAGSRSSSIRSHNSSTSSSSMTTTTTKPYKPKTIRNQFHSHPSPSPQIRVPSFSHVNLNNHSQKSNIWSIFRVGLVQTPEMTLPLRDAKVRSFNSSSSNGINSTKKDYADIEKKKIKKKKQWVFDRNANLFSGCKCSVDTVETVPLRMAMIKKSDSVNEAYGKEDEEEEEDRVKKSKQQGKQSMARHRTFEWLKQLSLESATDGE